MREKADTICVPETDREVVSNVLVIISTCAAVIYFGYGLVNYLLRR